MHKLINLINRRLYHILVSINSIFDIILISSPKLIHRYKTNSYQEVFIRKYLSGRINKMIAKFIWKYNGLRKANKILNKEKVS